MNKKIAVLDFVCRLAGSQPAPRRLRCKEGRYHQDRRRPVPDRYSGAAG